MNIEDNLKKLDIILPTAPNPVGSYVAYRKSNKLVFISGQISLRSNGELIKGKVGLDLTIEQGQEAACVCTMNILSQLKIACNNDFNEVKSCIKITGFVNSTNDFIDQPKIINGASELIVKIFEDTGKHSRAAVSVNSLPLGAAVEIESIFELN